VILGPAGCPVLRSPTVRVRPTPAIYNANLPAGLQMFAADECRVLAGAPIPESSGKLHPNFTQRSCTPTPVE
jgi:hypothetical protein